MPTLAALASILPVFLVAILPGAAQAAEPDFGQNVLIFDPSMRDIQERLDAIFVKQEANQFGSERYVYLFKPGSYDLDVQVGFYTHVAGLGKSPDDVAITGAVRSKARWMRNSNATCNFWRCVENLSVTPTQDNNINVWAVSQGTAMRRVHVRGDMNLWDGGWSSGGFLADCKIDGVVNSGSQQQWLSRNTNFSSWRGGSWNMVFVGTINPPPGDWPGHPYTVIEKTPIVREKPYLFIDDAGKYFVAVPPLRAEASQGTTWSNSETRQAGKAISIDGFYIARSDIDSATSLNDALARGQNLLLAPGIYHLDEPIRVARAETIVLGLGYPTLMPDKGTPAMTIADVEGVKVAGLLFDAGPIESPTLLEVGPSGAAGSHGSDPICLHDIFCRAGGATPGMTRSFVTINSSNVVGDNFWLWRADHGAGAKWDVNRNRNGLIVNGNDVTIYGLFVEHCQEYQTLWNGNGGRVYFYQSEMPYDPPTQEAWSHDGVRGFASCKVADNVTSHEAWGLGVYCVFHSDGIIADTAIEVPSAPGVKLNHMITVRLSGKPGTGIAHVCNDKGDPVISAHTAKLDSNHR